MSGQKPPPGSKPVWWSQRQVENSYLWPLLAPGLRDASGEVLEDPQGDLEVHRDHYGTLAGIDPLLSLEEVHDIINHKIDITNRDTNVGSGAASQQ